MTSKRHPDKRPAKNNQVRYQNLKFFKSRQFAITDIFKINSDWAAGFTRLPNGTTWGRDLSLLISILNLNIFMDRKILL